MKKSALIIGAGPAGIVSAKEFLEQGIEPIVLEKNSVLGGVWAKHSGKTWHNMRTNTSHFNTGFSDYPWPQGCDTFPKAEDVGQYLENYADHFNVIPHISYNQTIEHVDYKNNRFNAIWRDQKNTLKGKEFDHLIVAAGVFSTPLYPKIDGIDSYEGNILHSHDYKSITQNDINGHKILIIGGSFSGVEIATDIARTSDCDVTHIIRTPMWHIPREYMNLEGKYGASDLHKIRIGHKKTANTPEGHQKRHAFFNQVFGNPSEIDPRLYINPQSERPQSVVITDNYAQMIAENKIDLHVSGVNHLTHDNIVLDNGDALKGFDTVIFATGYKPSGSFLSDNIKTAVNYDKNNHFLPVPLYKATFHPNIPNMAFNSLYRGPHFSVMEMQARWAAQVFSNQTTLPDRETMMAQVKHEMTRREEAIKPQFPYADYMSLNDEIAREIDVLPDHQNNYKLEKMINLAPYTSAQYRLNGPGAQPKMAITQIERAEKYMKKVEHAPQ